jgi:hypothetical protein
MSMRVGDVNPGGVGNTGRGDVQEAGQKQLQLAAAVQEADKGRTKAADKKPTKSSTPPKMPNTDGMTEKQKFDTYAKIVNERGNEKARKALKNGDAVILGLRKETPTYERGGRGAYDDRIVVIRKDKESGQVHVDEFKRANTEPMGLHDGKVGADPNRDGKKDLGRLTTGTIEMIKAEHPNVKEAGTIFALRPSPNAVRHGQNGVERDTNHDGWFNEKDKKRFTNLNRTFKIHAGKDKHVRSAGCNTIHPQDYKKFEEAVTANKDQVKQNRWQYVLTDVSR